MFASIPSFATEPALIIVAATFLSSLRNVNWDDVSGTLPALVIILVMPLTFSIAAGIAFFCFCRDEKFCWRIQRLNTRSMGYFNFWFDMINFEYSLRRNLT